MNISSQEMLELLAQSSGRWSFFGYENVRTIANKKTMETDAPMPTIVQCSARCALRARLASERRCRNNRIGITIAPLVRKNQKTIHRNNTRFSTELVENRFRI